MDFSRAVLGSEHLMKQKKITDLENISFSWVIIIIFIKWILKYHKTDFYVMKKKISINLSVFYKCDSSIYIYIIFICQPRLS